MSKLDDLIRGLSPEEIVYKPMGKFIRFLNGRAFKQQELLSDGKYRVLRVGNFHTNDKWYYSNLELEDDKYCECGDLLYTWAATIGPEIWKGKKVIYHYHIWKLKFDERVVDKQYLYHYLKMDTDNISKSLTNSTMPHVSMTSMNKRIVVLPPLEVQREIVRILDNFTNLTAELTAELTARQKQYEFYRDKLLTFDALGEGTINFYQRTLGELFDFRNGLSKGKEFFGKGTPFIRYTDVYNHRTLRKKDITALVECTEDEKERLKVSRGDVLFTRTSETAEDIGWSSVMLDDMDDCVFNGFTIKATPKTKELLPEYCAYCFSTSDFRQYVTKHCAFTTRASLTGNTIAQYRMTIPPLDIQSRIVNVLDNFEKICSDLNIGLPAEIEARQKQYEYYRDKLLTFKEVAAT